MILDKNKEFWGALTKKDEKIQRIQIGSKNDKCVYVVFKTRYNVTFVTNADTITIEGMGVVGTNVQLWAGTYGVTFTKTGYRTETITINVNEDMIITKYLVLSAGRLNITTNPSGVNVYLNGVYKGLSPLSINDLSFGVYTVSLTKSNYQTVTLGYNFSTDNQTAYWELRPNQIPDPQPPVVPPSPSGSPPNMNPVYIANITKSGAKLSWNSEHASYHTIHLNGNFIGSTVSKTYQLSGLSANKTYQVTVTAINNYGTATVNTSFKTLAK